MRCLTTPVRHFFARTYCLTRSVRGTEIAGVPSRPPFAPSLRHGEATPKDAGGGGALGGYPRKPQNRNEINILLAMSREHGFIRTIQIAGWKRPLDLRPQTDGRDFAPPVHCKTLG